MSQLDVDKDVYSASCNPPRRAKRPRISDADPNYTPRPSAAASPVGATVQPRPILPRRAPPPAKPPAPSTSSSGSPPSEFTPDSPIDEPVPLPVKPASKRGRKPGSLSRSAREAQRRLNHSIIEKARRTKINNALATLKELVPLDYGKKIKSQEDNSDDEGEPGEEDDDDGEYGTGAGDGTAEKKKPKPKPSGKKEEKEREYKLEILVRTVAFMQDLLQRIAVLEQQQTNSNPVCSKCSGGLDNPASTHATCAQPAPNADADLSDPEMTHRSPKRARTDSYEPAERVFQAPVHPISPINTPPEPLPLSSETLLSRNRLPSISSWLPETLLDPSIFNVSSTTINTSTTTRTSSSPSLPSRLDFIRHAPTIAGSKDPTVPPLQLPTPPSSTHFQPTIASICQSSSTTTTTTATQSYPPSSSTSSTMSGNGTNQQKALSPLLTRTPEDEHAATMLLHISSGGGSGGSGTINSSPQFRPLPPSIMASTTSISDSGAETNQMPSGILLSSHANVGRGRSQYRTGNRFSGAGGRGNREGNNSNIAVQTPASLLGLITPSGN